MPNICGLVSDCPKGFGLPALMAKGVLTSKSLLTGGFPTSSEGFSHHSFPLTEGVNRSFHIIENWLTIACLHLYVFSCDFNIGVEQYYNKINNYSLFPNTLL